MKRKYVLMLRCTCLGFTLFGLVLGDIHWVHVISILTNCLMAYMWGKEDAMAKYQRVLLDGMETVFVGLRPPRAHLKKHTLDLLQFVVKHDKLKKKAEVN